MLRNNKIRQFLIAIILSVFSVAALAQSPAVSLRSVDGATVNLADQRGKVVVLAFGATWVPLSAKELPALQKLADRYAGRNVSFYWVSINSLKSGTRTYAADADLKAFATKYGLKLTVLRDPDQTAFRAFSVESLPTLVVLDRNGGVQHKQVGFDTDQPDGYGEVSQVLDRLVK